MCDAHRSVFGEERMSDLRVAVWLIGIPREVGARQNEFGAVVEPKLRKKVENNSEYNATSSIRCCFNQCHLFFLLIRKNREQTTLK